MKFLQCAVLLRVYTLLMCGLYSYTALVEPETLVYHVAHADNFSTLTMMAMTIFAVLGLVDLIVNDLLPDRYIIRRALRDRHLVNMGLAGCFGVQMWMCVKYQLPHALLPFYAVYVLLIPASAFADIHKRYNKKVCQ